jgi:drug/metabolite transporter (DMT)-like permease
MSSKASPAAPPSFDTAAIAPPPKPPGFAVDVALLIMCLFWAGNMIALKLLLRVLSPPVLSAVRFVIVTLAGISVVVLSGVSRRIERRDWPRLLLSGFLGVSVYQIVFMEGLDRTSAFVSNLMQGTEPLFALLLLRLTRTTTVAPRQWGGVLVALLGAVVFFLPDAGAPGALGFGFGDFLNLVSALVFATYGLVSAPLFARYPGATVMAWSMGLGTVPLIAWSARPLLLQDWRPLGPLVWTGISLSAILPVYAGFWIWNWGVTRKGLAHASLFIFVDIVLSGVFASLLLGERFGPARLLGAAIILAGVHLARRGELAGR